VELPFQPGLESRNQKHEDVGFGEFLGRRARLDRPFILERPRSARVPDASNDHRLVAAAVERELDVVVSRAIRGKPQPAAWRRNGKQVALGLQHVREHARRRRRNLFEKQRVRALRIGGVLPFLLRARFRTIDRLLELPSDLGYFHVCLVKLIVGD